MLCAKFQNDWLTETDVMGERNFGRFEFKMSFRRISYIAQHPRILNWQTPAQHMASTGKQLSNQFYALWYFMHSSECHKKLDESTARRHLKSPRSLSGRSFHLTLVTKWSKSHMTLKIKVSMSWPRSNPLSHLRPRVQIYEFAFCFMAIGPLLVEI